MKGNKHERLKERKDKKPDFEQVGGDVSYASYGGIFADEVDNDWPENGVNIFEITPLSEFDGNESGFSVESWTVECENVRGKKGEKLRKIVGITEKDWEKMNCAERGAEMRQLGGVSEHLGDFKTLGDAFREAFGEKALIKDWQNDIVTAKDWDDYEDQ